VQERNITSWDVLAARSRRLKYDLADPFDFYLMDLFLRGIYLPVPRPDIVLINSDDSGRNAVINYHESHHLMYECDMTISSVQAIINMALFFANANRPEEDIQKPEIPFEVMECRDMFDMILIRSPIIDQRTMSDWLAIYLSGLCGLRKGGVMMTILQDLDLPGYGKMKDQLWNLTRTAPVLEEDTPFTLDELLGKTHHRVSIYKRAEEYNLPPRPRQPYSGLSLN
jgi:hypothetical protein